MVELQLKTLKRASSYEWEEILETLEPESVSAMLWQGFREGEWGQPRDTEHDHDALEALNTERQLLLRYPEAACAADWIRFGTLEGQLDYRHCFGEWSPRTFEAFELALARDREAFLERVEELPRAVQLLLEALRMSKGESDVVSDVALDVIAKSYMTIRSWHSPVPDRDWGLIHRASFPQERFARAVAARLPKTRRVENWQVIEDVLTCLSPRETVAILVRYRAEDWRDRGLEIIRPLADARSLLEAELESLRAESARVRTVIRGPTGDLVDDPTVFARTNAAYFLAHVLVDAGNPVPETLDEHIVRLDAGGRHPMTPELDARLFAQLLPARASVIAGHSLDRCAYLVRLVDDESLRDRAVAMMSWNDELPRELATLGDRALGALTRALAGKPKVACEERIAQCLQSIATPAATAVLVELLGSSRKTVRTRASNAIETLGAGARESLIAGAKMKKKAIRDACRELLALLDGPEPTSVPSDHPIARLEAQAAALDAEVRTTIMRVCTMPTRDMESAIADTTEAHGPVVAVVLRDWFLETHHEAYFAIVQFLRGGDSRASPPREGTVIRAEDAMAAAYVVLDAVAQLPKPRAWNPSDLVCALRNTFGGWAGVAAAAPAVRTPERKFAEVMYAIAAQDPSSKSVLVGGLAVSSKMLRDLCVETLPAFGEAVVADVLPRLASTHIYERSAAAQVLAAIRSSSAAEALRRALERESSPPVRAALEHAIHASDKSPSSTHGCAASDPSACEAQLAGDKNARIPKWLELSSLPPLSFLDGSTLSEDARAGLIGRLRREEKRVDAFVAELVTALDPDSAAAFGEAIYARWKQAGEKASDKWALFQLGYMARNAWIHETAPNLDVQSSARHALAGWYLDVYARRGTQAAIDWIGYWADHATTESLRDKANGTLRELADQRKIRVESLRAQLNPFIAEERQEAKIEAEGYHSDVDPVRHLERAMLAGRGWTWARFAGLFLRATQLSTLGTRLVYAADEAQLFRVAEELTLIDVDGDPVRLPVDARIRVVHPAELEPQVLAAWTQHLEDADIVQPFEQMDRPIFRIGEKAVVSSQPIPVGTYLDKVRTAGFRGGRPEEAGMVYDDWLRMPSRGVTIRIGHSGYAAGGGYDTPIEPPGIYFETLTGETLDDEHVDPIAYSEAQYVLDRLFGGARGRSTGTNEVSGGTSVVMSDGYPNADLAPSARAKCLQCTEKIAMGDVRIIVERQIETPQFTGQGPGYMHPACALEWADGQGFERSDFVASVRASTDLAVNVLPEDFR